MTEVKEGVLVLTLPELNLARKLTAIAVELLESNADSKYQYDKSIDLDEKVKVDLILCISPSEVKQIKNCETSFEIWEKFEIIRSRL